MSKKCKAYGASKLGLTLPDSRKAFYAGWDAAVAAEREACAQVVEASPSYDWHRFACKAAAAIRARGEE